MKEQLLASYNTTGSHLACKNDGMDIKISDILLGKASEQKSYNSGLFNNKWVSKYELLVFWLSSLTISMLV